MKRTKWIVLPMLFMLIVVGSNMKVLASSQGWNLRYIKGAPSSEYILKQEYSLRTKGNHFVCRVSSITKGATVRFYFQGEATEDFTRPGVSRNHNGLFGSESYMEVYFVGTGYMKQTSYANGKITY